MRTAAYSQPQQTQAAKPVLASSRNATTRQSLTKAALTQVT